MAIIIYHYRLLRETPRALLIAWYDTNQKQRVKAWVPKSQAIRDRYTIQIPKLCYYSLKTTKYGSNPKKKKQGIQTKIPFTY